MKKLFVILLAFVALQVTAQTKVVDDPNAHTRIITGDFKAVSVATGIELFITQGNETSLAISVSDAKFEEGFKTVIVNGVLKLYYESQNYNSGWEKGRKLKAYLSVKAIEKLMASSGATVKTVNALTADKFELSLSSGSQFNGAIKATDLTVDQSSGSQVQLSGAASTIDIAVSSGASFNGFDLTTESCTAKASSGAEIKITTNKEISAAASSGGSIRYKGAAVTKDVRKSSGGSVKKV